MTRRLCFVGVFLLAVCASAFSEGPFLDLTFDRACEKAKQENKLVFIDFYTTWCVPCKKLDKTTWQDPRVVKWLHENTVPLKIDAEKEAKLAKQMAATAFPTLVFVTPDGKRLGHVVGYRDADTFLSEAPGLMKNKGPLDEARAEFERSDQNDPLVRQKYAHVLAREGQFAEALEQYLWCYDNGAEHRPEFAGVRNTIILTKISRMVRDHPPAKAALEQRRDAAAKALESDPTSVAPATDLIALNRTLRDQRNTLAVYEKIAEAEKAGEDVRHMLLDAVVGLLIDDKRYEDIVSGVGDAPAHIATLIAKQEKMNTASEAGERGAERLIDNGAMYVEALLATGNLEAAEKTTDAVLRFDPTPATYVTLIRYAVRGGNSDFARRIADRGMKELPEKRRGPVEKAAERIP